MIRLVAVVACSAEYVDEFSVFWVASDEIDLGVVYCFSIVFDVLVLLSFLRCPQQFWVVDDVSDASLANVEFLREHLFEVGFVFLLF